MVDSWLLMGSPGPVILILAAYLLFVLKIGPKMMENRPAFELKTLMIAYNAFQVVFSVYLASTVRLTKYILNKFIFNNKIIFYDILFKTSCYLFRH